MISELYRRIDCHDKNPGKAAKETDELFSLRSILIKRYEDIEKRGINVISKGLAVENPVETGKVKDSRYSVAAIGLISDPLDSFLKESIEKIKAIQPDARYSLDDFRHITFREVMFSKEGRKNAGVFSKDVMDYYKALRQGMLQISAPVELEFYKIIAAIDREQDSVSVIAGLLPTDLNILKVRQGVNSAISDAGLPLRGRLGDIPSVHVTLARFPSPPKRNGNVVPLLEVLNEVNDAIPTGAKTVINDIDVISTTRISYPWCDKHIQVWPPVSLTGQQNQDSIRFLLPRQRVEYNKIGQTRKE